MKSHPYSSESQLDYHERAVAFEDQPGLQIRLIRVFHLQNHRFATGRLTNNHPVSVTGSPDPVLDPVTTSGEQVCYHYRRLVFPKIAILSALARSVFNFTKQLDDFR